MLHEEERIRAAREFVRKLADGVDPISQQPLPADCTYNNVRVSRCLFFVCEVLDEVLDNAPKKKKVKQRFVATAEVVARLKPHSADLSITKFSEFLSERVDSKVSKQPIIDWLFQQGYLEEIVEDGTSRPIASERGQEAGMRNVPLKYGPRAFTAVFYTPAAQQIIIDSLPQIFPD